MKHHNYHYNQQTCRYEPYRMAWWAKVLYSMLFLLVTGALFLGIQYAHSRFFETAKAKALRLENKAMKTHRVVLQNELDKIENTLALLKEKDATLYENIFETPAPLTADQTPGTDKILLANKANFRDLLQLVHAHTQDVSNKSLMAAATFGGMEVTQKDLGWLMSIPSIQPVTLSASTKLTSGFGKRINPYHKGMYLHPGADFAAPRGTRVVATGNGRVIEVVKNASLQAGYGNYIEIDHGNGIVTRYAHLEEVLVKAGQKVTKGMAIGKVGMSGGAVAPHLHYEIIRNGKTVNPLPYMMEGMSSEAYTALQKEGSLKNQSLD